MFAQNANDNPEGPQEAEIPVIRSFEFAKGAIGDIKKSVNQFRGSASIAVDLLTLPGHEGLDIKVSAIYSSSIKNNVATWNIEAPTGILGLGWDMPFDFITVFKNGSGSPTSDNYYLFSSGAANPMVKIGEVAGQWSFQLRNYEFWQILYDPSTQIWTIVKENGFIYTYGGIDPNASTIQWGAKWGNWTGNSSQRAGQEQYPVAWNLASIESPWGQSVTYTYNNVNQSVGENGLEFTQASYVESVTDSFGRTITFNYGEKFGPLNTSSNDMMEYQAKNYQQPEPNAYQNRYETLYLDSIDVKNAEDKPLYSVVFSYSFFNAAPTSDPNYSLFWKRCLKSVCQVNLNGATLPSMYFEYNGMDDINPGAIKSILYPSGGIARFTYKTAIIDAPKDISIQNPLSGSLPGVWHGSDYVVFTFCLPVGGLSVLVYSWNGRWVGQDITAGSFSNVKADPDSVLVTAQADFIAISLRNVNANRDEIYLYRKDRSQFGSWINKQSFYLNLQATGAVATTFAVGTDFVIAYNKEYSSAPFQRISYNWQDDIWIVVPQNPPSDATGANGVALAALQNYYIVAFYLQDNLLAKFLIYYRDSMGLWNGPNEWTNSNVDIAMEGQQFPFSWTLQPAFAVATYVRDITSQTIEYSLRVIQWDENFSVQNPSQPYIADLISPVINGKSQYDILNTLVCGPTVNNNLANLRNIGGNISNWLIKDFPAPASSSDIAFACGEDVMVMSEKASSQNNWLLTFNPNFPSDGGWTISALTPNGQYPTVSDTYLTIGSSIYVCNYKGQWNPLKTGLNNLSDQQSVQNRGPNYIAYQGGSGSNSVSYIVALKNGQAKPPQTLPGQSIYVPPDEAGNGSLLAGPRFLVSYPASQPFNKADTLTLYNLDEGDIGGFSYDYPVACIEIDDAIDPMCSFCQSFFYESSDESQIAYNPAAGIAQYPSVTVVPGIKSLESAPPSIQPQGRSVFYYSNGLSPQSALDYKGWIYNYQYLLNGALLAQEDYDSEDQLVSSQLNFWKVYTIDIKSGKNLYGGYARLVRTVGLIDGIETDSISEFDENTGLVSWEEQTYYDFNGDQKSLHSERQYAWQVPEYANAFSNQHIFTAIAQSTKAVVCQETLNYIESQVTTYRNWTAASPTAECPDVENCRLAPYQVYKWTSPGSNAPQFDFSPNGDRSDWLLTSEVTGRYSPSGAVEEQTDVNGIPSSFLYDVSQRYLVARFQNGSKEGDEVSHFGFEDYETDQGWTLGLGAAVIPNSQYQEVDAHTGSRSLRLAPSATGNDGIARTFKPLRQDQSYIFSAWVKKPNGFDSSKGNASWQITVAGSQPVTVQFPDIMGDWTYIYQIIDMPVSSGDSGAADIEILGENANSLCCVLIDDLRFSPQSCLFEGFGYDTLFWQQNAILGVNGESSRTVFNEFQQPTFHTNGEDKLSEFNAAYFSRQGNQGEFSNADPNHTLIIRPSEGGDLFTFTRGSDWQRLWIAEPDVWAVENCRLSQKSAQTAGTLSIDDPEYDSDYALAVNFDLQETVTQPLGLRLSGSFAVQWSPQEMEWQLLDNNANKISAADAQIFVISADLATDLNAGIIPSGLQDQFADEGYPLPQQSTVSQGIVPGKSWYLISPDSRYRYYLIMRDNGSSQEGGIDVCKVASNWIALVGSSSLLFWANGQMIFSYQAPQPFSASPQFFFGNQVAISLLACGMCPQADVTFEESRGIAVQSQNLADNCVIVRQTITDTLGREAVHTKAAYLDPGTNPLFTYCSGFASLDWDSGIMSGLINNFYKDDNGYPYYHQAYEASPLQREIEEGMPGELFCVGAHSSRISYTSIGATPEDTIMKFLKSTTTNPNGDIYYEVRTLLNQVIYKVSIKDQTEIRSATIFDDAGSPIELRSPNYYNPPAMSGPEDWACLQTFDYAGRLKSSTERSDAPRCFIYDRAGNLRFSQDPQGALAGTFNYVKYDLLGRPVEMGYVSGAWDEECLQAKADADPAWPPSPNTWRKKLHYDGSQETDCSIGRLDEVLINNEDQGQNDIIELFRYNLLGHTISHSLTAEAFDPGQYTIDYEYNNVGNVTQITYPAMADGNRLEIYYRNNRQNQVIIISQAPDFSSPIASFSYLASGELLEERLDLGTGQKIQKDFIFNSPLWPVAINQNNQAGETIFAELLSYTEGGFLDAGYYDGSIAAADYQLASDACKFQYSYDSLGQIENAENSLNTDWNLGVKDPVGYDPNGNFLTLERGDVTAQYNYCDHTERVQQVLDISNGSILASCDLYDGNGNVKHYTVAANMSFPAHDLTFDYDPFSNMATQVIDANAGKNTLLFSYGSHGQRVLKEVQENGQPLYKKLYIRGINAYPLCELTKDEVTTYATYIYGPGGLIAIQKNNATYGVIGDHLGSVRAVVDQQAQIVASYNYQTFGALTQVNELETGFMPYLFTGQEYDHEIGLYNYRARFYSGDLGRFIGIDPERQFFSPYIYASNNPVRYIDPDGSMARWARILLGIGLLAVGVALTIVTAIFTAGAGSAAGTAVTSASYGAFLGAAANVATQITVGAGLGAASGAALAGGMYSINSNKSFGWSGLEKETELGAIGGAICEGVGEGLSYAGQEIATSITGIAEGYKDVGDNALLFAWRKAAKYVARSALITGASRAAGSLVSGSVTNAVSNIWGMTDDDPSGMGESVFKSAGIDMRKGAVIGALRGAWDPLEILMNDRDYAGYIPWVRMISFAGFEPW